MACIAAFSGAGETTRGGLCSGPHGPSPNTSTARALPSPFTAAPRLAASRPPAPPARPPPARPTSSCAAFRSALLILAALLGCVAQDSFSSPSATSIPWTVPDKCIVAQGVLSGGGGGGGAFGAGGPGAQVAVQFLVAGGTTVGVFVGGGGVGGAAAWGQGGYTCAGAGGAASAITYQGALLAIAAGGGGGATNGASGGATTGCTGSAGGTPNGGTPACTGPGQGATQSAIGARGTPSSFTGGALAAGPVGIFPVAQSGGDGAAYTSGTAPINSVKSIGFAPGGWGGCFNPPSSYPSYRGGGGGGGGYYGGGGGKTDGGAGYVGSPGGGGSSWVSAAASYVFYSVGVPGGEWGGNGVDGQISMSCVRCAAVRLMCSGVFSPSA